MTLLNDLRRQRVAYAQGRTVDGEVRVRGLDLHVAGRSIVVERRVPVAVVVMDGGRESRYRLPREPGIPAVAFVAAPIAAFVVARIFSPKRRK